MSNSEKVAEPMKAQYAEELASQVVCDRAAIEALGVKCVAGDFVEENHFARHAADSLCQKLLCLAEIPQPHSSQLAVPREDAWLMSDQRKTGPHHLAIVI